MLFSYGGLRSPFSCPIDDGYEGGRGKIQRFLTKVILQSLKIIQCGRPQPGSDHVGKLLQGFIPWLE